MENLKQNSLGNIKTFKMLPGLITLLNDSNRNTRQYVYSFLTKFNERLKFVQKIEEPHKTYILHCIKQDYTNKANMFLERGYTQDLVSHVKCFINAKIKSVLND